MENLKFKMPTQDEMTTQQFEMIKDKTGFDISEFNRIVSYQKSLNVKISSTWETDNLDWQLAIILETAEMLDSVDWKWWKKGNTDWKNLEIEMIDLLHFLIAKMIELKQVPMMNTMLMSHEIMNRQKKEDPEIIFNKELENSIRNDAVNNFLNMIILKNYLGAFTAWLKIWYSIGKDANDMYKLYQIKYCLNIFRQDHGYKDGSYLKMWNGEEDNVTAQNIGYSLELGDNFYDSLYEGMEKVYNKLTIKDESIESFISSSEKWSLFMEQVPSQNKELFISFAEEFKKF